MSITKKYFPSQPIKMETLFTHLETRGWSPMIRDSGQGEFFELIYDEKTKPSLRARRYINKNGHLEE